MKRNTVLILTTLLICSCKTQTLNTVIDAVGQQAGLFTKPSDAEISSGLKEALALSIEKGAKSLHQKDAYFKNEALKILLPEEAKKVTSTLNKIGLGSLTEELVLRLNRAAEDAALSSIPIFKRAILSLKFSEALKILTSSNSGAATAYLKQKTLSELTLSYQGKVQSSLKKVGADVAWSKVFLTYNRIPGLKKVNPSLSDYATEEALKGIFLTVSKREALLRSNLKERNSALLQKVFGYADSLKR